MKKMKKKLELSRETVRSLSQVDLGRVAGATADGSMCWSNPEFSCQEELATGKVCAG